MNQQFHNNNNSTIPQLSIPNPIQLQSQSQQVPHQHQTILKKFISDQDCRISLQQKHIFIKVVLGQLFVQSYRLFKINSQQNLIILIKKKNRKTFYHLLYLVKNIEELKQARKILEQSINQALNGIKKMIRREVDSYQVSIAFIKEIKVVSFQSKDQYQQFITQLTNNDTQSETFLQQNKQKFKIIDYIPKKVKQNQQILFQTSKQLQQLKNMISMYVDTFGNQQKASYFYRQLQKKTISFSVDMLLNTINYIIYQQTKNQPFNQIQSAYWTCFQKKTRTLQQDRKHLLLTGNGQCCILQIIFMKQIKKQNRQQYLDMLHECKKHYKKAKIKLFRITNNPWNGQVNRIILEEELYSEEESHNKNDKTVDQAIMYKFDSVVVGQYPKN